MKQHILIFSMLAAFAWSCGNNSEQATAKSVADMTEEELMAYAQGIHERVITLDTHDDINVDNFSPEKNYTQDLETQVTLPKMELGGLDVAWFIVYTGQGDLTPEGYAAAAKNAMDKFTAIHRLCEEFAPERIELALSSDDVRRIIASGKKVAMIGVENAYPMGEDISLVKKYHELGARYMSLAHNGHSQFSDSNTGEADSVFLHGGVSELGKEVIKEMNKWGIMVDISHPSNKAIEDMLELSQAPVIASHSSARTLSDHSRNLSDELLLKVKENGGVVQAVALGTYVNKEKVEARNAKIKEINERIAAEMGFALKERRDIMQMEEADREAYMETFRSIQEKAKPIVEAEVDPVAPPVDVADFVNHIDYMVKLMGVDHVGISSDFDGGGGIKGWDNASETFNVTLEMVRRGYSEEDIAKIWSGNLLRVLDEVQAKAAAIQAETN